MRDLAHDERSAESFVGAEQLLIPEKLYGRSTEIQELLAAFDRVVAEGRPELMLVSGSAGIGKSSVVSELHRVLVPARGLFASGKFDQHKRDIPYATLAKAFQTLIQHRHSIPTYFMYLCFCRIVNATLEYGTADTSAHGYAELATILGPVFHRYADGNCFGELACTLTERHGFNRYKTKVYFCMQRAMLWTQPIQSAIDFIRRAIDSAAETHDTAFTCFGWNHLIAALLFQGVPLDEVGRESQNGIDFVRKVKMRDEDAILQFQKRLILTLRGERPISSRGADTYFNDQFVESEFEARKPFTAFYYWTAKLHL